MKFDHNTKNPTASGVSRQVHGAGLEPARLYGLQISSLLLCQRDGAILLHYFTLVIRLVY